jgi:archaellum biogenesis ATPase FlaH
MHAFRRLESVHELTGSFAPGELIFIAGGTGNGKSLLCQNLFDDLTVEQKVPTLYIGTEQTVEVLKIKHACIRIGVSPRLILKPDHLGHRHSRLRISARPGRRRAQAPGRAGNA